MKFRFNLMMAVLVVVGFSFFFVACKKKEDAEKSVISVKGSDTMVNLVQKWAEEYMKLHPDVSIQVTGGGSGTGIAALMNGTTDIAASSRELKPKEKELASEKKIEYKQYEVALDGLAIIVNPANKLDSITMEQARDIFIGKIKNYSELGGSASDITLYGRENSSGTYEFFKEHVLGKDEKGNVYEFAPSTQVLQGTAALAEAVAKDVKGIAYGGVGYFAHRNDVKILKIKKDKNAPAIAPASTGKIDYQHIWTKEYSISRYLYLFSAGKESETTKGFLEYVLSEAGQKQVETMEYIPLPKK